MMTKKIKKRIWSFWKGNLNKQEAQDLLKSLDEQRANMQEQFERQFAQDQQELLSPERSQALLKAVQAKAGIDNIPVKKMYPYSRHIAAAILVIFGVMGLLYRAHYASSTDAGADNTIIASTESYMLKSDADTLRYILRDGSTLVLSPYSTIQCDPDYGVRNRTITLTGEGRFKVKRDSLLPFEVTANGFTTTALGTEFIVNGSNGHLTEVKLLHGKIVVRSTASSAMQIPETFLHIGDKLSINTQTQDFALVEAHKVLPKTSVAAISSHGIGENVSPALNFQRTALQEVFLTIADRFDIQVAIDGAHLDRMTFTGSFTEDERPEIMLAIICRINNLVYEQISERSYVIRPMDSITPQNPIILDTVKN
ncbi:MAG: FecR family protein [Sphingobacterium sp.]|jgi:ferric-dicitrate binding protein FerR (iron transport regulator)|nr:FecR family protein [Sphingobacterium sp.]